MTKLGYCGRRERFSSDVELAKVFWKLWHSKKEYFPHNLSDGWSGPEEQQKFKMICEAMQGDWETGTTPFDLFDKYEESGEDELEDMRDFNINYWRQIGNYDSNANDYLWNAKELYIRRDMLKNYLKDLNSGVSEDIVDSHYWPEFTDVEKDSIYGLLQWWDSSLDAEEIDTWFSQYPPMINVVETRWIEDARPELFTTMPIPWNPDETYMAESSENMVGECGYCASMQGYTPENMLLIADYPQLSHDFCKSCNSHHPDYNPTDECEDFNPRNPDVYEGNTWFCQGCGSGTKFLIDANKWVADAETFASEIIELGELKMVEDATHDQCHENGIDGSSCDGKMISVPAIPGYFGRSVRHLMCQKHIHNYWGALAWYEQENNLERIMGNGSKLRFNDMSNSHHSAETFASECESCDEESDGGVYECDCCYQVYCENCFEETVDAGHSPYRGSIDEWMSITKNPRIEETSTGSSWTGGAICGNCAAEIETELYDLTPIPELMEDEQGTANLASEAETQKDGIPWFDVLLIGAVGAVTIALIKR